MQAYGKERRATGEEIANDIAKNLKLANMRSQLIVAKDRSRGSLVGFAEIELGKFGEVSFEHVGKEEIENAVQRVLCC